MYPTNATPSVMVALFNSGGTQVASSSGAGNRSGSYTPPATGWITLRIKNNSTTSPAQNAFVKVNYMAPTVVNTATAGRPAPDTPTTPDTRPSLADAVSAVQLYPNPTTPERVDKGPVSANAPPRMGRGWGWGDHGGWARRLGTAAGHGG